MKKSSRTDKTAIVLSLILVGIMVFFSVAYPMRTVAAFAGARDFVSRAFGSLFELTTLTCTVAALWMMLSKYGDVRLGREKPEYSTFSWLAMSFCAGMGGSILYWSALEWIYYIQTPPFGYEPFSRQALEYALPYSLFHWGFAVWAINIVGAVTIGYQHYVRKEKGITLKYACRGLLGKLVDGWLGRVIDVLFVFSILATITLSFGTLPPMLTNNIVSLFHMEEKFGISLLIVLAATAFVIFSAGRGMQKGMRMISNSTIWGCFLICGLFLVLGHPLFAIENSIQSTGIMLQDYVRMLTNMDTIGQSGFPQTWTFFLFSGCICLAPWMWIFIARISRGRSVRAIVGAILAAGFCGTLMFFGTISNYAIKSYMDGTFNVLEAMSLESSSQVISDLCLSLPIGPVILAVWFLVALFLLITTMDSAAATLADSTTFHLTSEETSSKHLRVFWAVMLPVPGICLLYAGQFVEGGTPLGSIQALLFIFAIPISVLVLTAIASGIKLMWEDHGKMSREEIIRKYRENETEA